MAIYNGIHSVYNGLLGVYADQDFTIREVDDPIDWDDNLLEIYYKWVLVGSYVKSKIIHQPIAEAQAVVQRCCREYLEGLAVNE